MFKLINYVSKNVLAENIIVRFAIKSLYLISPLCTMKFIDSVVDKNFDGMVKWGIISVVLLIVSQCVDYLLDYYTGVAYSDSWNNIFKKLDKELLYFDFRKNELSENEINQMLGQNYEIVKPFIFEQPLEIIFSVIMLTAILVISFMISPISAITMMIVVPVCMFISFHFGDRITNYSADNINDMKDTKGFIIDKFRLSKQERFLEDKQLNNIDGILSKYSVNVMKKVKLEAFYNNILIYGMLNGAILITTLVSGSLVYQGLMTIGGLYSFQTYVSKMWGNINFLSRARNQYLSSKPAINDFSDFLDTDVVKLEDYQINNIQLVDYVGLGNGKQPLHKPINVILNKHEIYLINGENGTGKTTLVECILGLSSRYSGQILINGRMQNTSSDAVYSFGKPYISEYGVLVSHKNESYGQQKMADLNLVLKTDKTLYVFDEPTNFLDASNRLKVQQKMKSLAEDNKIVVAISHDEEIKTDSNITHIELEQI